MTVTEKMGGIKIKKADIILFLGALFLFGGLYFWSLAGNSGGYVSVYVDGKITGNYSLNEDRIITIDGTTGECELTVKNGEAYMSMASCPDGLCMMQKAISHDNETIVCLPNRVVIKVEDGSEDSGIDAIVQ